MSSKSSSHVPPLKRKVQAPITPVKKAKIELKSQRHYDLSEDDIIRSRLLFEGDQGSDDRRISTLIKTFNKSLNDLSSIEIEKLFSSLYSIEHSYRLLKSTIQMDEREQLCYAIKSKHIYEQVKQLRSELDHNEGRLIEAKQRRLNLLEYDQRTDTINKLGTRKELRAQQVSIIERKRYFEHLQQTFEATYQQRLKQIAVYMRPIFEFDDILQQDAHEDGPNESSIEQQITPSTPVLSTLSTIKADRQRTYSDSSITSIDGDENILAIRSRKQLNRNHLGMISLPASLTNNEPQPLFSNDIELYGTQLVNPLLFLSSSLNT